MKAVVVADGEPVEADWQHLAHADLVIAADGGSSWLVDHGRQPDLVVGDLDSLDPLVVERLTRSSVQIERHSADKESSDTELAVLRAFAEGADEVVLLGGLGGSRLDHELANLLLLAAPDLWPATPHAIRIVRGATVVRGIRDGMSLSLDGAAGDRVTLLPVSGDAHGVRTEGLRYPLNGETLRLGRSRGLSNQIVDQPALVSVDHGTLIVVHEGQHTEEE